MCIFNKKDKTKDYTGFYKSKTVDNETSPCTAFLLYNKHKNNNGENTYDCLYASSLNTPTWYDEKIFIKDYEVLTKYEMITLHDFKEILRENCYKEKINQIKSDNGNAAGIETEFRNEYEKLCEKYGLKIVPWMLL